jgi:signal transduction histidine kinase
MQAASATTSPILPAGDLSAQYHELAELASRLIHEIKNHLGTLSLNLQLLGEDLDSPETQRERRALQRVKRLQGECQRLSDLSNDFLRFARIGELRCEPVSLKQLLDDLVDFAAPSAQEAKVEIKTFLPADLPTLPLDRELVQMALLNIMLNAQQAMPNGGTLTIQAEVRGEEVSVSFIDTGVGMTPEVQGQIFRPFYSIRPGGTGLGLPTAQKIIHAHNGRIDVQSEPGRGSKFTVVLPGMAKLAG